MKKIILPKPESSTTINLELVDAVNQPIFAKRNGELSGMVCHDNGKGWILRTGGKHGAYGYHKTLAECLELGEKDFSYTFHV